MRSRSKGRIRMMLRHESITGRFLRLLRHESRTGDVCPAVPRPSPYAMITVTLVTGRKVNIITKWAKPVPWAGLAALGGAFLARQANAHGALFGSFVIYIAQVQRSGQGNMRARGIPGGRCMPLGRGKLRGGRRPRSTRGPGRGRNRRRPRWRRKGRRRNMLMRYGDMWSRGQGLSSGNIRQRHRV